MQTARRLTSLSKMSRLVFLIIGILLMTACSVVSSSSSPTTAPPVGVPQATVITIVPGPTPEVATNVPPADPSATAINTMPAGTATVPPTAPSAMAQNVSSLPDPSQYAWKKVISGIKRPLFITGSEDGSGRLFIVLQTGLIMIAKEGQLLEQPFLDIQSLTNGPRTDTEYSELGLLGLAFDPDFVQNGFFYVNYTNPDGFSVLARYTVSSQNPDQAESSSAVILLTQKQPYPNHNGGMLAFGPDGMLYMGLGDGGAAGDPQGNGQNLQTLLGKILRIDVHNGQPYRIPADNPFFNSGGLPEIWAFGLRNPWRFSFDRLTGDFYIADVGQKRWEEINFVPVGSPGGINFGWDFREGAHPYEGEPPADLVFQDPITEYSHSEGCSVSGGVVVRDPNLIEWQGVYLYGDFCSGRVWGLLQVDQGRWLNAELFQTGLNISSFGEDDQGRIYLADHAGGDIYRLERK